MNRIAALSHEIGLSVKVIFRDEETGKECAKWMSKQTYHAFPIDAQVTPDDFARKGIVKSARNTNIYDNEQDALSLLCNTAGWQGGTVHQIDTIVRLAKRITEEADDTERLNFWLEGLKKAFGAGA